MAATFCQNYSIGLPRYGTTMGSDIHTLAIELFEFGFHERTNDVMKHMKILFMLYDDDCNVVLLVYVAHVG